MDLVNQHAAMMKSIRAGARAGARAKMRRQLVQPSSSLGMTSEEKLKAALDSVWNHIRPRIVSSAGSGAIRRVDLEYQPFPKVLMEDSDTFSSRGNRMAMVYVRSRALADEELKALGLRAVHLNWDEDCAGEIIVEFAREDVKARPDIITDLTTMIKALPPHRTYLEIETASVKDVSVGLDRLRAACGLDIRLFVGIENIYGDGTDSMLVWDPPGGELVLPPVDDWDRE